MNALLLTLVAAAGLTTAAITWQAYTEGHNRNEKAFAAAEAAWQVGRDAQLAELVPGAGAEALGDYKKTHSLEQDEATVAASEAATIARDKLKYKLSTPPLRSDTKGLWDRTMKTDKAEEKAATD
jgi:hypothetical protein